MKITGIIWLDVIVEKLQQKHNVREDEVREVLGKKPHFRFSEKGHRRGENVYAAFGQTEAGRYLVVYFVHKRDGRALVISAREMKPGERGQHERK